MSYRPLKLRPFNRAALFAPRRPAFTLEQQDHSPERMPTSWRLEVVVADEDQELLASLDVRSSAAYLTPPTEGDRPALLVPGLGGMRLADEASPRAMGAVPHAWVPPPPLKPAMPPPPRIKATSNLGPRPQPGPVSLPPLPAARSRRARLLGLTLPPPPSPGVVQRQPQGAAGEACDE